MRSLFLIFNDFLPFFGFCSCFPVIFHFLLSIWNVLWYNDTGGDFLINSKRIGHQLKELRISRGWKQKELADKVGLSRPAMSNIESGKRSLTLNTLKRFCEVFNVDISYFGIETGNFDEAVDLMSRVEAIFNSDDLADDKKDDLYRRIMQIYLDSKK